MEVLDKLIDSCNHMKELIEQCKEQEKLNQIDQVEAQTTGEISAAGEIEFEELNKDFLD